MSLDEMMSEVALEHEPDGEVRAPFRHARLNLVDT
jgi:hypothetical protein